MGRKFIYIFCPVHGSALPNSISFHFSGEAGFQQLQRFFHTPAPVLFPLSSFDLLQTMVAQLLGVVSPALLTPSSLKSSNHVSLSSPVKWRKNSGTVRCVYSRFSGLGIQFVRAVALNPGYVKLLYIFTLWVSYNVGFLG